MTAISRKRPRINPHQFTESPRASSSYDLFNSVSSLDCATPAPLANTEYCLFGGLDTPGAWSEQRLERAGQLDAERDYRYNRFSAGSQGPSPLNANALPSHMGQEHDNKGQRPPAQNGGYIRKAAWALTGGLAGKIFNFCWNTTFRGFEAGGGQAYTDYAEVVTSPSPSDYRDSFWKKRAHVPGSFPGGRQSVDGQEQYSIEVSSSGRSPMVYSRHVSEDSITKNNWVLVEHGQSNDHDQSPIRKRSRASVAGLGGYDAAQPVQPPRIYTASFASPRRTTSTASVQARPHSANKRPRVSLASPNKRQSSLALGQQSPASPEIDTYQRKRRKEDKRQDQSLRRLNAQLQDMIREGQQALGSKIEIVDDHNTDEGYFDDELR
ncbi:hypothetical protein PMZ80_009125 [Knufia obscura]|uniref:Uncharacterized protein n=2 Tax=Knufia TaxID=430999 RepID=A0AAN8I6R2_9EURO|nr:hypothetical protein PMZ80_009125 [Knufia obscura]KAK5954919.1 hypothetical protein OHC33_003598 [Knufia fluminis]